MFGQNIYLLIGLLFVLVVLIVLIVAVWTAAKVGLWQLQRRRAERDWRGDLDRDEAQRRPPTARGLCQGCGLIFDDVYHCADGRRLCRSCYAASHEK